MIRVIGGSDREKEVVYLENPYSSDPDQTILQAITEKYEGKIIKDMYVCKILKVLDYGPWIVSTNDNDGNVYSEVIFECEVFQPTVGDIIIGAVCEIAGRGQQIPRLMKDKMCISVALNNNIEQILKDQKITVKIKDINWEPHSSLISIIGTLTHARVYPSIIYEVDPKEVVKFKDVIKGYDEKVKGLVEEIKEMKPFVIRAYPFSSPQTLVSEKVMKFGDVFEEMVNGKVTSKVRMVDCCFLDRCGGEVYIIKLKPHSKDSLCCIKTLYENQIKALTNIKEMSLEYPEWTKDLAEFYSLSKKNNDSYISIIKNGIESLK